MSKEQQMIEYMVQDLAEMHTETQGGGIRYIYNSQVYEKLIDTETGLYRESPAYVYGLLQDELNFGRIVQAEV